MNLKRAISVHQLYSKKRTLHRLPTGLHELIGEFEMTGSWIIWGQSGNGKTSLACQLAKALSKIDKVWYNSIEEGDSVTLRNAFKREKMEEVKTRVLVLDKEPINELSLRLKRQRAAKVVVIDSAQYANIKKADLLKLEADFPTTLFVWVSHEEGKLPRGSFANDVLYHSNVKIRVVGFKAFALSRYIENPKPYTISQARADEYWASEILEPKKII